MKKEQVQNLNQEVKDIWNKNAIFWDGKIGKEGNDFHRILIEPAQEKLLNIKKDELILDIACGNGQFSRKMADAGARVIACDLSENFIKIAKEHSAEYGDQIEYSVVDATKKDELRNFGKERFDSAVCTMAIMDMVEIEPMIEALTFLLKPGGRFVFSICHPCFNSSKVLKVAEQEDKDGEIVNIHSLKILDYITPAIIKGVGIDGQPVPQYYFHRSLSELFNVFFKWRFMLDRIEEPVFPLESISEKSIFWKIHCEIPPVLSVRMRLVMSEE